MRASNLLNPGRFNGSQFMRRDMAAAISFFEELVASGANSSGTTQFAAFLTDCASKVTAIGTNPIVRAPTALALAPKTASVARGSTLQLVPTITPYNATNTNVSYASSNTAIATVNASTGLVTPVAVGTVTITGTTALGAKTDTATITVT